MAQDGQQVDQELERDGGAPDPQQQGARQQGGDDGLPKTQAELDALIEKRLARERKKLAKQSAQQESGTDPGQQAADTAAQAALGRELLIAKAQLDAYREGVTAAAVEDAVLLAVLQAEKAGEADEDGVREALKEVLKRHPEWKPQKKDDKKGGFKVGVDTSGAGKDSAQKRSLPSGKVIF